MTNECYIPSMNLMGAGCLHNAVVRLAVLGFSRALIVIDHDYHTSAALARLRTLLATSSLHSEIFDRIPVEPTVNHVAAGVDRLDSFRGDCIIALGGTAAHDCAKAIALVAANGDDIRDYEGVNRSAKPAFPLVAINTSADTASEITRFCRITDVLAHRKITIVDKHVIPMMSVNDPQITSPLSVPQMAEAGMDALTHAIEAYVSTEATPTSDESALKAISLISRYLPQVMNPLKEPAVLTSLRSATYMAGMALNNASLGYVHALAHQLGSLYDLPHGVCNAVLLPHVQSFNAKMAAPRLADIGQAMGLDITAMSANQAADNTITALCQLAADMHIPTRLKVLGVRERDLGRIADNALNDACGFTNPRNASRYDLIDILNAAM